MAVGALIAAAYVWLSTPIYRATTRILSPDAASLISYNVASMLTGPATIGLTGNKDASVGIPELTVDAAYATFQRHLSSDALRLAFFQQTYLPAIGQPNPSEQVRNKLWQRFNRALEITPPGPHDNAIAVALSGTRPDLIATLVNQYVTQATKAAQQELTRNLKTTIKSLRTITDEQIAVLRGVAATWRKAKLARLQDALAVAESVGMEDPPTTGNLITSYTDDTLYLRGARAIRAEIRQLQQRKNDDPYIAELPSLLKHQALLQAIKLAPENLGVALVDSPATAPTEPTHPRTALVLLLGILAGALAGTILVLLRRRQD